MVFGPWDFQKPQKEVSGNFESMTYFALLIGIYLPCEFHKFPLRHSLETPKRRGGGVSLKDNSIHHFQIEIDEDRRGPVVGSLYFGIIHIHDKTYLL